jgi:DNA-binding NtrC family response regulator
MALTLVSPGNTSNLEKPMSSRRPTEALDVEVRRQSRRQADRRRGLPALLAVLAEGIRQAQSAVDLRERFEQGLQEVLNADGVWIRNGNATSTAGREPTLSAEIPLPHPLHLEVSLPGHGSGDDWEVQTLRAAATIAALVLSSDRTGAPVMSRPSSPPDRAGGPTLLLGSSDAIQVVRERVERVASTDFTVLIEGESGTGKELVARQIHELSPRRRGPFVAVNCAALVESLLEAELFGIEERTATGVRGRRGKFELADQGTLFLDEASDLSMSAQAKLLRAIQDMRVERVGGQAVRRVDTRIIVATNRSLAQMVERGRFRLDLFYRLSGVEVIVPPLRCRPEDVPELARAFLERLHRVRPLRLSSSALDALTAYHWPGNVRELERAIERAVALTTGDTIELDDLPPAVVGDFGESLLPSVAQTETLRVWASRYAKLVLERHGHNRRKACEALGISSHTLRALLRRGDRRVTTARDDSAAGARNLGGTDHHS